MSYENCTSSDFFVTMNSLMKLYFRISFNELDGFKFLCNDEESYEAMLSSFLNVLHVWRIWSVMHMLNSIKPKTAHQKVLRLHV